MGIKLIERRLGAIKVTRARVGKFSNVCIVIIIIFQFVRVELGIYLSKLVVIALCCFGRACYFYKYLPTSKFRISDQVYLLIVVALF